MILIALLAAAVAGTDPAPTTAAPTAEAKPAEKLVCRSEPVTGSLFSKKVCHTKAEWDAQARAARELGARVQGGSSGARVN